MDRSLLLDQLVRTETHISADAQQLLRHQAIIEELERRGEDAAYVRSVMRRLEEMLAMRIADRDRMRAALASSTSSLEAGARETPIDAAS